MMLNAYLALADYARAIWTCNNLRKRLELEFALSYLGITYEAHKTQRVMYPKNRFGPTHRSMKFGKAKQINALSIFPQDFPF